MSEEESVAREDEEDEESEENEESSSMAREDDEEGMPSARRNPMLRIQSLQSSLKSAVDDYCIQFHDMEAQLIRAKSKIKDLAKRNSKLKEELKRAKEGEELSKKNLEQTKKRLRNLCTTFAAVKEECDKVCNEQEYPGAAQQLSKKRKYVLKVYEGDDFLNCPICKEPWTQSGEHYACSLSCGHFFGRSCITQWILRDRSPGSSNCPVCSNKATLSDIRHHFVSQIYDGEVKLEQAD